MRDSGDQSGIGERRGIHRDFVGAGIEDSCGILQRSNAAAHGERNKQLPGGPADDVEQSGAVLVGGGNIQQHNLVRSAAGVAQRQLGGIARISQAGKLHALHHASAVDVEAGDNAFGQHLPVKLSKFTKIAQQLKPRRS